MGHPPYRHNRQRWAGQRQLPKPDIHIKIVAALPADLQAPQVIVIKFWVFSDGHGFTHARRLRTEYHFYGLIIAIGHLIADQID